jgi:hypothetical protein
LIDRTSIQFNKNTKWAACYHNTHRTWRIIYVRDPLASSLRAGGTYRIVSYIAMVYRTIPYAICWRECLNACNSVVDLFSLSIFASHSLPILIQYYRYSILAMTATLMIMSFAVMGTRPISEGFASFWSALMLCILSIGGTMIMRKFHNSMAVGFFMGSIVAMSQLFFLLFLV